MYIENFFKINKNLISRTAWLWSLLFRVCIMQCSINTFKFVKHDFILCCTQHLWYLTGSGFSLALFMKLHTLVLHPSQCNRVLKGLLPLWVLQTTCPAHRGSCFHCPASLPVNKIFSLEVFMEVFISWVVGPVSYLKWARTENSDESWPLGSALDLLDLFFVPCSLFLK